MRIVSIVLVALVALAGTARADDPLYTCKETPATTKISVSFAPQTSLKDLVTWVVGFTCKTIVFDSDVEARVPRVTIVSPKPMTPKAALQLFVDAVEATGLKVVHKKDTMIIKLGPDLPKTCPSVATVPITPSSKSDVHTAPLPEPSASDVELEKLFDKGIKKIDDTNFEVSKAVIDAVLANPMAVAKGARVVPAVKNGKPDGFKLYAIRPSSVYARLGLTNGDTLHSINGFDLTSADKALEVYTKIREATSLQIEVSRRGKIITLSYTIK